MPDSQGIRQNIVVHKEKSKKLQKKVQKNLVVSGNSRIFVV